MDQIENILSLESNEFKEEAAKFFNNLAKRNPGEKISDLNSCMELVNKLSKMEIIEEDFQLFTAIGKFLKSAQAYKSADYLEDYFDLDFEKSQPGFVVDYTGNYTFAPDELLPVFLREERKFCSLTAGFYFSNIFTKTNLRPNLEEICIPGLEIESADFTKVNFDQSVFTKSSFKNSKFKSVSFYKANLNEAVFYDCEFENINFQFTKFKGTKFINCKITESNFGFSDLSVITLENCSFFEVNLGSIDFGDTDFKTCEFDRCWCSGTNFSKVRNLTQEKIDTFLGADSTKLPANLKRPAFWPLESNIPTWYEWLETGNVVESQSSVTYK